METTTTTANRSSQRLRSELLFGVEVRQCPGGTTPEGRFGMTTFPVTLSELAAMTTAERFNLSESVADVARNAERIAAKLYRHAEQIRGGISDGDDLYNEVHDCNEMARILRDQAAEWDKRADEAEQRWLAYRDGEAK